MVLETLSALPPKQRAVLVMHELDGVTMKDIARALGLPLFTAYSRLRVARQRFAKELRRRQQLAASAGCRRPSGRPPRAWPAALLDAGAPHPGGAGRGEAAGAGGSARPGARGAAARGRARYLRLGPIGAARPW